MLSNTSCSSCDCCCALISSRFCRRLRISWAEIEDTLKGVEHYLSADEIRNRLQKREEIKAQQHQSEQDVFDSIEQQALDSLSDDELQDELDGLADVIKELKKEQSKRKKGDKGHK